MVVLNLKNVKNIFCIDVTMAADSALKSQITAIYCIKNKTKNYE